MSHSQPNCRRLVLAATLSCLFNPQLPAWSQVNDPVASGFSSPPMTARPRVWWHWLNGNITREGIAKDLDWMSRAGLGGVHNFDAEMMTPQVVPQRLPYMSPKWAQAFKFAAELAERKGLELGIAASPGWSLTGGPWVRPADGMKKLVWSETLVDGGRALRLPLGAVPETTGPFQNMFVQPDFMGHQPEPGKLPRLHGSVAVYACPASASVLSVPVAGADGVSLDAAKLAVQSDTGAALLAVPAEGRPTIVTFDYPAPQTLRSATIFVAGAASIFQAAQVSAVLEARSDGGHWRKVADLPLALVPASAGFSPVTAARFRVVFSAKSSPSGLDSAMAPGADMASFAAPEATPSLRLSQLRLSNEPRVNQFEAKAGFSTVDDYYALDAGVDPSEPGIAATACMELSGRVDSAGTLNWAAPAGTWKILRIGWSLTGVQNHPATPEATGLEVDKYDGRAVRHYLETYLSNYKRIVGKDMMGQRGVRALVTDSTEVGTSNWTPRLREHFKRLRGYDPRPWLPALTGVIIESRARTDAFLYDYRRTLADLMASEHYGTVARVAHEHGLRVYSEALESARVTLGDDMAMRRHADVPMAAMWAYRPETGPSPTAVADMRGAASVSHLYGRNLVAAESLTSEFAPWAFAPADLRPMIDMAFANGVNLPVIHTSVHQPLGDDRKPGLSLAIFGQYFNRNETWAGMARPWVDYMARSAWLLRQGRFYADVAYFYGEEAPLVALYKNGGPADAPRRYAYDFVNADALLYALSVRDGDLVTDSGARYRLLYLGGTSQAMSLSVLRKIHTLAAAGATIVGSAPQAAPGLADDAAVFAALVRQMWSGNAITPVGKGQVITGGDAEAALHHLGQRPDFDAALPGKERLLFVHRRLPDGDLYLVVNPNRTAVDTEARFNVRGKAAQFWAADTGRIEPATYRDDGVVTTVPLALAGNESVFVVFRRAAAAPAVTVAAPVWRPLATLDQGWHMRFEGLAAPDAVEKGALGSLSERTEPLQKYFSGTTVYRNILTLPAGVQPHTPLRLDLGRVGDVAEVFVNGKSAGIAWKPPFATDIGALLVHGSNTVEVRVANLWVNRLIGDAQPGARKVTFTSAPTYKADAPLRPSGLIGPVTLQARD